MTARNFIDDIAKQVDYYVSSNMSTATAEKLGLDPRAAWTLYVDEETIAVAKNDARLLNYYGGFEYVDADDKAECGDYVFYFASSDRVQGHLDTFYDRVPVIDEE